MSELKPGKSKTIQWDHKDTEGNQVKAGTYSAMTTAASRNSNKAPPILASTNFIIY